MVPSGHFVLAKNALHGWRTSPFGQSGLLHRLVGSTFPLDLAHAALQLRAEARDQLVVGVAGILRRGAPGALDAVDVKEHAVERENRMPAVLALLKGDDPDAERFRVTPRSASAQSHRCGSRGACLA